MDSMYYIQNFAKDQKYSFFGIVWLDKIFNVKSNSYSATEDRKAQDQFDSTERAYSSKVKERRRKEKEQKRKKIRQMANSIYYQHILVLSTSICVLFRIRMLFGVQMDVNCVCVASETSLFTLKHLISCQ